MVDWFTKFSPPDLTLNRLRTNSIIKLCKSSFIWDFAHKNTESIEIFALYMDLCAQNHRIAHKINALFPFIWQIAHKSRHLMIIYVLYMRFCAQITPIAHNFNIIHHLYAEVRTISMNLHLLYAKIAFYMPRARTNSNPLSHLANDSIDPSI